MKFKGVFKNVWIIAIAIIVLYVFSTTSNKIGMLYNTILGRAILLSLIISATYYNKILGLLLVGVLLILHNTFSSTIENMESGTTPIFPPSTNDPNAMPEIPKDNMPSTMPNATSTMPTMPVMPTIPTTMPTMPATASTGSASIDPNTIPSLVSINDMADLNEKIKKITDTISAKQPNETIPMSQNIASSIENTNAIPPKSEGFGNMGAKNNRSYMLSIDENIRAKPSNWLPFISKQNPNPSPNWSGSDGYMSFNSPV